MGYPRVISYVFTAALFSPLLADDVNGITGILLIKTFCALLTSSTGASAEALASWVHVWICQLLVNALELKYEDVTGSAPLLVDTSGGALEKFSFAPGVMERKSRKRCERKRFCGELLDVVE